MNMDDTQLKREIQKLVDDFRANYDSYRKQLEANTETKLVEPLFKLLGWTTADFEKQAHAQRGQHAGRADYAFKIKDRIVFFLEAKKVGMPLDKEADKQVISYALSKRIPFAISTNFEETKIFCVEQENAIKNVFRIFTRPEDYVSNLSDLKFLSKQSFEEGLTLKRAEAEGRLKKRVTIDQTLLDDLMRIRSLIASDIEKVYPQKYDLNEKDEIVQRIIDRLIFIRRCEDVGINPDNCTLEEIKHLPDNKAYPKLKEIFKTYNDIYNSGLFAIGVDNDCDKITIDGSIIKKLVYYLYESKDGNYVYNFDWIDADVLGQVYEQYLGKILAQTKSGKAKLKEGQAHRKEQGIYYTPTFIVDYIIKNTIGELLKPKKLGIRQVKVLDPACGSGSFLIKTFDYLYSPFSLKEDAKQKRLDSQGTYSLKTEILKNNIYGVDLDKKAVEITKLNLLLKAAEKGRRLPPEADLHIRHGNSLIDDQDVARLDAFTWEGEFSAGSFDAVIGNPPYLLMQPQNTSESILEYFKKKFAVAQYKVDTYHLFFEKAILLAKEHGYVGFITPNTFLLNIYLSNLRKFMLDNCKIVKLVIIPQEVFPDASVDTAITILQRESDEEKRKNNRVEILVLKNFAVGATPVTTILQKEFLTAENFVFNVNISPKENTLIKKLEEGSVSLGEICRVSFGLQTKDRKTYVKDAPINDNWKPCIDGGNIFPYVVKFTPQYFLHDVKIKAGGCWDETTHNVPEKVVIRQIGVTPIAALENKRRYSLNTIYNITGVSADFTYRYILALINSKLMKFYWKKRFYDSKLLFPKIKKAYLDQIPIKKISRAQQEKINRLVDKLIDLNERLLKFADKQTSEKVKIEEEVKKTYSELDKTIYENYNLTASEIQLVESES